MTFAGLSNPQDRADVEAFLNSHSDSPLPLPKAPAAAAPAAAGAAPGTGPNNGPQKAEKEPVPPTSSAGKTPQTTGGEGAGMQKTHETNNPH
jgi:cytochrome c